MGLYSFNKSGYKSDQEIGDLYDKKIKLFLNDRDQKTLPERDKAILQQIQDSKHFDPRIKAVCFGTEEEAKKAVGIADNLNSMTDWEFIVSSYPYEWLYQINTTICRVVNNEAVKVIMDIYNNVLEKNK